MNILQILPELNVGGVETGTVDFAKYLIDHGHKSIVISNGGPLVEKLIAEGSTHISLPVHKKSIVNAFKLIKKIRQIICEQNIDIVHARSRVPAWAAYFACKNTSAEFITTCHGYYKSFLSSQVMGWSKLVIVPSNIIARHMIEDFHVAPESIRCIARSVDLGKFKDLKRKVNKHPVVAILGRITPLKGHNYFIQSMAQVLRRFPQAKIWVVGDSPAHKEGYRSQLEVLVKRLGIDSKVIFLGNRNDVPDLLREIDCVVMASIEPESFGRVIIEAQAASVPVVATRVGGVVDIIEHEKTGLLVMPKDISGMAKAVIRILEDKNLAKGIVEAAMVKIHREYTVDKMASRTIDVYKEVLAMHNILVIKLSAIGDVVLITASLRAIRKKFPKAKVTCLIGKEARGVLINCPYIDELIAYDYKNQDKGVFSFLKLTRRLRRKKFDQIIDFQNNRRSHAVSFLCFANASIGFDNGKWGKLLSMPIKNINKNIGPVEHQFQLLNILGINHGQEDYLELWPNKKDTDYIEKLLESEWMANSKKIVGINLSASKKWQTKNWPIDYVAKLCDMLTSANIRVVLTGVKEDLPLYLNLIQKCKSKPSSFIGKTNILELAALLRKCSVFVTPDSASMHVAAAVKTPFIAFFGPTDSSRHIPPAEKFIIIERKLNCSPCYKSRCKILTHACMRDINPEMVFNEVKKILGEQH